MKMLILGGGWVGARFCLQNPSTHVITARSKEALLQLKSLGLEAVEFDLAREDTWVNLPPQESVTATVITFALSASQLPSFEKLFAERIAVDKPILCLGTTSVFQVEDHKSVVDESTPMTGTGVTGASLVDRVEGENWMLSRGAAIFYLSGIVGSEKEEVSYGESRSVRSFFEKGYARNGFKLINLIHVKDICKVIGFFLKDDSGAEAIKGKQVIVSCGAFRYQDLAKGLGVEPLPEFLPPDKTMNGSKIVSTARLCSMLPTNYEWTLPVPGVEPVSRGLPLAYPLEHFPNAAARDRQWELLKYVFEGKWQGTTLWYDTEGGERSTFLKGENLPHPSYSSPGTEYHVCVLDADTIAWQGIGLRHAPGERITARFSRGAYNTSGNDFFFQGGVGRCLPDITNVELLYTEANFLYERSRSMVVTRYKREEHLLVLDTICASSLRCGNAEHSFPRKPPQSEVRRSVDTLLAGLSDKTCRMQWMSHTRALDETDGGEIQTMPTKSMLLFSDTSRLVQSFDDDQVCSIPTEIQPTEGCDLVFGCRHTDDVFKAITMTYNLEGKIERYTYEIWN